MRYAYRGFRAIGGRVGSPESHERCMNHHSLPTPTRAIAHVLAVISLALALVTTPAVAQSFSLEPIDVGADNPQVAPHVPASQLAGFGRRTRLGQYVPFAFRIPAHPGASVQRAILTVTIAQIQTTAAGADTIEASGQDGWPGEVLFRDFNPLYGPGEDPRTAKEITIDLLARDNGGNLRFPNTAQVVDREQQLFVVQRENSSVLAARLELTFGTAPPPTGTATRSQTPSAGTPTQTTAAGVHTATPTSAPAAATPSPTTASDGGGKCRTFTATDVPAAIPDGGLLRSLVDAPPSGTVESVRIVSLRGVHSFVGDLEFRLVSPTGSDVVVLQRPCGGSADFDVSVADAGAAIACPLSGGQTLAPVQPLARFRGEQVPGTWTLEVYDRAFEDHGILTGWGLEICYEPAVPQPDCSTYVPSELPRAIPDAGTLASSVSVPDGGRVRAVSVLAVDSVHPAVAELELRLTGPSGSEVLLLEGACAGAAQLRTAFDDLETSPVPCPPNDGLAHRPLEPLAAFFGEPAGGTWTLRVRDRVGGQTGSLNAWALRVCVQNPTPGIRTRPPTPTATATASPTLGPSCACGGDCDCSGSVTVDEILRLVTIALGEASMATCRNGDSGGDGRILVDDVLRSIGHVLTGCP